MAQEMARHHVSRPRHIVPGLGGSHPIATETSEFTSVRKYEIPVPGLDDEYSPPLPIYLDFKGPQCDSQLHVLPREVLELIIGYLDGKSALRLAGTCGLFLNLVNERALWKQYVFSVDQKHFESINPLFGAPSMPQDSSQIFPWKEIYLCGQVWKSVHNWKFVEPLIYNSRHKIVSANIAGQFVVFATQAGDVAAWNPDESNTNLRSIFTTHAIVDEILVQLCPDYEKKSTHYRVIVHSIDTSLFVYDSRGFLLISKSTDKNLRRISSNGDSLFEWNAETGKSAFTYLKKFDIVRCTDYCNFQLPFGPFVAVDILEQLFISQERGPYFVNYDRKTNKHMCEQLLSQVDKLYISKAYIWPGQISLSIAAYKTIISVGRRCTVIKWPLLFNCISAALFGSVLIVGTNRGQVLFYPFQDPEELLSLDPLSFSKLIQLPSVQPLIYVGVRAQNSIHEFPDVIAVSRTELFCCRALGFLN